MGLKHFCAKEEDIRHGGEGGVLELVHSGLRELGSFYSLLTDSIIRKTAIP